MKKGNKIMKELSTLVGEIKNIHPYSLDVLKGCAQFSVLLLIFAIVMYFLTPYTAHVPTTIDYYRAAVDVAPAVMATGVLGAFLTDLVLSKYNNADTTQSQPKSNETDDAHQDKDVKK